MLYTIFMRKTKDDHSPFAISVAINSYLRKFGKNDVVIAIPGYMSNKSNTINHFLSSIKFPPNTYFAVGMNGTIHLTSTETIQQTHNKKFSLNISGFNSTNKDHAKMMFFLENKQNVIINNASQLLSLNVKAVLIGSSNQSNTTYFSYKADKGEADLLLINGDFLTNDKAFTSQDEEILKFFNAIKYPLKLEENYSQEFYEVNLNNIALFKEFNENTTINLNKMFKESIQGLIG